MASNTGDGSSSLLQFLTDHALRDFPDAFNETSNTRYCELSKHRVEGEDQEMDLINSGMISRSTDQMYRPGSLYVHIQGGSVRLYSRQEEGMDPQLFRGYLFPEIGRLAYRHNDLEVFKQVDAGSSAC